MIFGIVAVGKDIT